MRVRDLFAGSALLCLASMGREMDANALEAPAPDSCDVSGVKLGASAAEAAAALKAKFGSAADLRLHPRPSKSRAGDYTNTLDYRVGDTSIHIEFAEHMLPDLDRREVAYEIEYKIDNPTPAEQAALRAAVLAKYGAPSDSSPMMHWSRCPHLEFGANILALLNGEYVEWERSFPVPAPKTVLRP